MHENDAIRFHNGGQNVKIMYRIRDRSEKKPHSTLGGFQVVRVVRLHGRIQPLDKVESSVLLVFANITIFPSFYLTAFSYNVEESCNCMLMR